MMPESKGAEVATEATSGTCGNCAILNRSLDEYVAALLTLKQKIIDTDHLLSEFKEKCDELQKSQRETSRLHTELDEVLLKLGPLEKQTAEYEAVKTELEHTKATLKTCQQKTEELEGLREENAKALALKQTLEDSLKKAEDAALTQSMENAHLKSEKKSLEDELQKSQESLKVCQQTLEEMESLRLQNAKTLILKSNLENQLLALEDAKLKQKVEIEHLNGENSRLEENLVKTQEKLSKLEKEFNKEKRCISTQTAAEPTVNKAKVRMLLDELWQCVEPLHQTRIHNEWAELQNLSSSSKDRLQRCSPQPLVYGLSTKRMPVTAAPNPANRTSPQTPSTSCTLLKFSPVKKKIDCLVQGSSPCKEQRNRKHGKRKTARQGSEDLPQVDEAIESLHKGAEDELSSDSWGCSVNLGEILDCFRPFPAALSPIPPFFEMVGMADDLSVLGVKENGPSNDEREKSTSTPANSADPKALTDVVVIPIGNSSLASNLQTMCVNPELNALNPDSEVLENVSSDIQDMDVEEHSKEKETCVDVSCADTAATLQNREQITAVSQPSATKVSESQSDDDGAVADGLSNEVHSSELNQQLMNADQNLPSADDGSVERPSKDQAAEKCFSSEAEPESPLQFEDILGSLSPEAATIGVDTESTGNQSSDMKQENESTSLQIVEVSSAASRKDEQCSDDEEFLGLKTKVRGDSPRLDPENLSDNLDSAAVNESQLNREVLDQSKTESSDSEEEGQLEICEAGLSPENEPPIGTVDNNITADIGVNTTWLETSSLTDGQQGASVENKCTLKLADVSLNSKQVSAALSQQEKNEPCGAQGNEGVENVPSTDLKTDDISSNPQDSCESRSALQNAQTLTDAGKVRCRSPFVTRVSREAFDLMPSPESLGRVLMEMGPPLPPAVMPLTATPPKCIEHYTPIRSGLRPNVWLLSEGELSVKQQHSVLPFPESHIQNESKSSCLNTPSPTRGVPSSPLQFGSATPKHAVPVPGRLPSSALNSPSSTISQENSMQMLDTMYPELSAQARTLNILRGNVNLGRGGIENGASPPSVSQISGNKTINSSSTAFTKTEQQPKRRGANVLLPKSAKKLRLDACSPILANLSSPVLQVNDNQPSDADESLKSHPRNSSFNHNHEQDTESKAEAQCNEKPLQISDVLEKLQTSCFNLMPVVRSHLYVGRISEVPALTDEEKLVISHFCSDQSSAEELMSAILTKMRAERSILKQEFLQSLCRVYIGLCRQTRDRQKAQAFAYSVLKEGFPEAPTLILFMVVTWPSVLQHDSSLIRAIHTITELKADIEISACLSVYLHWDKRPPDDIYQMISSTLKAVREEDEQKFQKHNVYGEDLCPTAWENIFTLDLLCAHLGWKWTHDNVIGKELWPTMNSWVTQPRDLQTPLRNVSVAAILRLIGRLGQQGLKENFPKSVVNIARAINLFCKHGITEGVPWEVQLSAVYAVYDLAPSNPKEALEALASWRGETNQTVPPAVTSCINKIGFLCRQIKS